MSATHPNGSDNQPRPHGFPHPQGQPVPPPPHAHPAPPAPGAAPQDDVWGVRPPALGPQPTAYSQDGLGQQSYGPQDHGQGTSAGRGSPQLDRGLSALQKLPLRRDTSDGIIGGVAAGVAHRLNVSTAAVRLATVALALFFGSGIAAYLIAWALLPDESGRTHVERGVRGGSPQSLVLTVLAGLAALGMVSSVLESLGWLVPVLVTAGIVGYVVHAGRNKDAGAA